MKKIFLFVALISLILVSLFTHPGKTDKYGGHKGPNGYHYHNSGSSGGGTTTTKTTTPTPVPQEATTTIYEGNDFQEALNLFLLTCDNLEKDLPYFQSLGIGDEKSIKKNARYYVYKTTRSNNTLIRFNDFTKEKRVTLIFAKNSYSFNNNDYKVSQYPNEKSRVSANNWVMEMNK